MKNYTEAEIKDITEREKKALLMLLELELTPSCQILYEQSQGDTFVTKLVPYLQDLKYAKKIA